MGLNSKAVLKARWGKASLISSCTVLWLVYGEAIGQLTLSVFRCQEVYGLHGHGHQVINLFHLVVDFSSWKPQEICMRYYCVLQRGTGVVVWSLTTSNSLDVNCSPPVSSVHGISQGRILEGVATSFFKGSSRLRGRTSISCIGRWIIRHWATREALREELQ